METETLVDGDGLSELEPEKLGDELGDRDIDSDCDRDCDRDIEREGVRDGESDEERLELIDENVTVKTGLLTPPAVVCQRQLNAAPTFDAHVGGEFVMSETNLTPSFVTPVIDTKALPSEFKVNVLNAPVVMLARVIAVAT